MSSLSLPQLFNGTIPRNRNKHKYMSIDSRRSKINRSLSTFEEEFVKKRKPLSKNGTIPRNTFRGVPRLEIERTANMICHNMTIDELYEEVLHEIIHNIGCEASEDCAQDALIEYVQDAFKITNEEHVRLLDNAKLKEAPEIRLNVEIIKAENLLPKDSNGFSDPFVTMYLESNTTHRYNTSVKTMTLNPEWEEHFSLPIPENPNQEILVLEVWDFDAAETVGEKVNKLFDVKGVKGLRKLMKEIAVTASTGKHDNELIGRTSIPLKTIPASGIRVWYNLEKGTKTNSRGSVLIHMSFSAEKNNKVALQEHRHLLRILLMHELETSKVAKFWWSGKFNIQADAILTQHSAQSGMTSFSGSIAKWSVYTNVHQEHPLSYGLFIELLDKVVPTIQTLQDNDEVKKLFWEGCKQLLPSCFSTIRKIRNKAATDKNCVKTLAEVILIIFKITSLEIPITVDLYPRDVYGWCKPEIDEGHMEVETVLRHCVEAGALEWFEHINENGTGKAGDDDEQKLDYLVKLIQLIRTDLQKALELYDKMFQQKLNFPYAQTLYKYYEGRFADISEPIVKSVCRNIKRITICEDRYERLPEYTEMNMGTSLFELYLVLRKFVKIGEALCPSETEFVTYSSYEWFTPGVMHWLDISVYKAMSRIEKAIDLDKLVPIDETVKYSSSAVDTLAIFNQIKIFWEQLGWPDVEGSYALIARIVDDICRCCVFYADRMSLKVEKMHLEDNSERFQVTSEWCLAINNIDYIRRSLAPFIKELGIEIILKKLAEYRTEADANRCRQTIDQVVENAMDTEKNKIIEIIEDVARKMNPTIHRFLTEGAEILQEDSNSMDRLMMYLDDSLKTLHEELNDVNFGRILNAIWCELSYTLLRIVESNVEKRRPPAFFSNLKKTLDLMIASFKLENPSDLGRCDDEKTLTEIEKILALHAFETGELIHQYYLERLEDQKSMSEPVYGQLTVRAKFSNNELQLEIMNARNLLPMDSNGSCDSFVKVHFLPQHKFLGVSQPKTGVKQKTLYPLYEENFNIVMNEEQRSLRTALLVFSVKDRDMFGMSNQYIAEAYLTIEDIENSNYEQIHMTLSRPEYKETQSLRVLEHRLGDKQAKEFIKKLKTKSYS
ncbi:hypothetical protein ACFFRR_008722 [Megaselia abdita]